MEMGLFLVFAVLMYNQRNTHIHKHAQPGQGLALYVHTVRASPDEAIVIPIDAQLYYYATLKEVAAFSTPFLAPLNHLLSPACALQM